MLLDKFAKVLLNSLVKSTTQLSNEFKNERVAQMLYANDGGNATFPLDMSIPEVAHKQLNSTSKAEH